MKTILVIAALIVFANIVLSEKWCDRNPTAENSSIGLRLNLVPTPEVQVPVRWNSTEFHGLVPGESFYKDVKNRLGKPAEEGVDEEADFEEEPSFDIYLRYSNVGEEKQAVEIYLDRETKIVKEIDFLPNPPIGKEEVIARYGANYFEISSSDSICVETGLKRGPSPEKLDYPILLVYPERGIFVSVDEKGHVLQIGLPSKCKRF